MKEIWKNIPGFPMYQVSDIGRVRSTQRTIKRKDGRTAKLKGKVLSAKVRKVDHYHEVLICNETFQGLKKIHRLVMSAFVGDAAELMVNHKDMNPGNNRLENLEYVSRQENFCHAVIMKGRLPGASLDKKTGKWRAYYYEENKQKYLGSFETEKEANKMYATAIAAQGKINRYAEQKNVL